MEPVSGAIRRALDAWISFSRPPVPIDTTNADGLELRLTRRQLGDRWVEGRSLIPVGMGMDRAAWSSVAAFAQRHFAENVATSGIK